MTFWYFFYDLKLDSQMDPLITILSHTFEEYMDIEEISKRIKWWSRRIEPKKGGIFFSSILYVSFIFTTTSYRESPNLCV